MTTVIGLWGVFLGASNFSVSRSGFKVWPFDITYFLVVLLASSSTVYDPLVSPLSWAFLAATLTDRVLRYVDESKIEIVGVKVFNIYSERIRKLAAIGTNAIGMMVSGWALNNITPATFHNVPTQIVGIYGLWEVILCLHFLDNKTLKVKHYPMMSYFLLSSLASQESAIWLLSLIFFFLELSVTFSHKIGLPIPVGELMTVTSVVVGFISSFWVLCYVNSVGYLGISSKLVALYGVREFVSCIPDYENWKGRVGDSLRVQHFSWSLFMLLILTSFQITQESIIMWSLAWCYFVVSLLSVIVKRINDSAELPTMPYHITFFLNIVSAIIGGTAAIWVGIFG